jgi:hypothetical protein
MEPGCIAIRPERERRKRDDDDRTASEHDASLAGDAISVGKRRTTAALRAGIVAIDRTELIGGDAYIFTPGGCHESGGLLLAQGKRRRKLANSVWMRSPSYAALEIRDPAHTEPRALRQI